MQVEFRQHRPHFLRFPMKQWQDAAFEAFLGIPDPRPSHLDRPSQHAEVPCPPMTISIDRPPATNMSLRFCPANKFFHFLFQESLNETLNVRPGPTLQSFIR